MQNNIKKWVPRIIPILVIAFALIITYSINYYTHVFNNIGEVVEANSEAYNSQFTTQKSDGQRIDIDFETFVKWSHAIKQYVSIAKLIDLSECPDDYQEAFKLCIDAFIALQQHLSHEPPLHKTQAAENWELKLNQCKEDIKAAENKKLKLIDSYAFGLMQDTLE